MKNKPREFPPSQTGVQVAPVALGCRIQKTIKNKRVFPFSKRSKSCTRRFGRCRKQKTMRKNTRVFYFSKRSKKLHPCTNPSPGEKTREVEHPLVARQRAEALAVHRVLQILRGREQYVASAAVKHQLNGGGAGQRARGSACRCYSSSMRKHSPVSALQSCALRSREVVSKTSPPWRSTTK